MYSTYKKIKKPNLSAYEDVEQREFVRWLGEQGIKFTAIPNSTYTKSPRQKRKNFEMGLRAGLPDIVLIVRDRLIFIEMKREKGGQVSLEQKEWIKAINNCRNGEAYVCRGAEEAKKVIEAALVLGAMDN